MPTMLNFLETGASLTKKAETSSLRDKFNCLQIRAEIMMSEELVELE